MFLKSIGITEEIYNLYKQKGIPIITSANDKFHSMLCIVNTEKTFDELIEGSDRDDIKIINESDNFYFCFVTRLKIKNFQNYSGYCYIISALMQIITENISMKLLEKNLNNQEIFTKLVYNSGEQIKKEFQEEFIKYLILLEKIMQGISIRNEEELKNVIEEIKKIDIKTLKYKAGTELENKKHKKLSHFFDIYSKIFVDFKRYEINKEKIIEIEKLFEKKHNLKKLKIKKLEQEKIEKIDKKIDIYEKIEDVEKKLKDLEIKKENEKIKFLQEFKDILVLLKILDLNEKTSEIIINKGLIIIDKIYQCSNNRDFKNLKGKWSSYFFSVHKILSENNQFIFFNPFINFGSIENKFSRIGFDSPMYKNDIDSKYDTGSEISLEQESLGQESSEQESLEQESSESEDLNLSDLSILKSELNKDFDFFKEPSDNQSFKMNKDISLNDNFIIFDLKETDSFLLLYKNNVENIYNKNYEKFDLMLKGIGFTSGINYLLEDSSESEEEKMKPGSEQKIKIFLKTMLNSAIYEYINNYIVYDIDIDKIKELFFKHISKYLLSGKNLFDININEIPLNSDKFHYGFKIKHLFFNINVKDKKNSIYDNSYIQKEDKIYSNFSFSFHDDTETKCCVYKIDDNIQKVFSFEDIINMNLDSIDPNKIDSNETILEKIDICLKFLDLIDDIFLLDTNNMLFVMKEEKIDFNYFGNNRADFSLIFSLINKNTGKYNINYKSMEYLYKTKAMRDNFKEVSSYFDKGRMQKYITIRNYKLFYTKMETILKKLKERKYKKAINL